jgi:hypothetical protein
MRRGWCAMRSMRLLRRRWFSWGGDGVRNRGFGFADAQSVMDGEVGSAM